MPRIPPVPRLPIGPDPLRRVRVPRDLEAVTVGGDEADPDSAGMDSTAVERIWQAGLDLYRSGVHPALQLCLRRHSEVILNRAIGHVEGNGPRDPGAAERLPVGLETPFCVYSTSKAVTAMVVHMLEERGALSIEDPVAQHIPEYAVHRKGEITIGQVLAHRAGVARISGDALDLDKLVEREELLRMLCDVKPAHSPGRARTSARSSVRRSASRSGSAG
jgi:CubicO group peptidase (beta-lactamase class C family)